MEGVNITGYKYSEYDFKITPSAGSGSHLITTTLNNKLGMLLIEPTTNTTAYKFNITRSDGKVIYNKTTLATGRLGLIVALPLVGDLTFNLTDVSVDEEFEITLFYL